MSKAIKNKIPDNIWNTDCRFCSFRCSENNFEYGSKGKCNVPCRISRYSGMCLIWNEKTRKCDLTEHEAYKEHCPSCRPSEFFGICHTCKYFNPFHERDCNNIYCTYPGTIKNRYNTMPHINAGYTREITSWNYTYFTCSNYKVDNSDKKRLIREALLGRIPKNFNPVTWELLKDDVKIEELWDKKAEEYEEEMRTHDKTFRFRRGEIFLSEDEKNDVVNRVILEAEKIRLKLRKNDIDKSEIKAYSLNQNKTEYLCFIKLYDLGSRADKIYKIPNSENIYIRSGKLYFSLIKL